MKISELSNNVKELKTEVTKVFTEQQTKYDALQAKYDTLLGQLENVDVPADAQASLDELKTLLQQLDDTIPDTEPTPETPADGTTPVGARTN